MPGIEFKTTYMLSDIKSEFNIVLSELIQKENTSAYSKSLYGDVWKTNMAVG